MAPSISKRKKGAKTLEVNSEYERFDLDGDGVVSDEELSLQKEIHEMERLDSQAKHDHSKQAAQRRMANIALFAMLLFTIIVMTPLIPETRVKLLGELSALFYISMAGIVGAYMGMTAWMARKK
jgi:hypothetical protein|tara:strand:+ start:40 stop:411 length:372 start_codon:yes stop_codon:yes gene_type:complete